MNGYTCAMLRCYYPLEFTTSYLNWCEDKDDLDNGHKLLDYYNITLNPPRFRYSKSEYFPDKKNNAIYKGISSIKFLNSSVADFLYTLKDKKYKNFSELLFDLKGNVDSRKLEILIKIDFFEEFGKSKKLLKIVEAFDTICTKKTYKYDNKYIKYILPNAKKVTEKTVRDVDLTTVMNSIEQDLENENLHMKERIKARLEFTGECDLKDESIDGRDCVCASINTKYAPKLQMYNISTGKVKEFKISKKLFSQNKIEEFDYVRIVKVKSKPKKKNVDGKYIIIEGNDLWIEIYDKI